jgi:hypothetical protein
MICFLLFFEKINPNFLKKFSLISSSGMSFLAADFKSNFNWTLSDLLEVSIKSEV